MDEKICRHIISYFILICAINSTACGLDYEQYPSPENYNTVTQMSEADRRKLAKNVAAAVKDCISLHAVSYKTKSEKRFLKRLNPIARIQYAAVKLGRFLEWCLTIKHDLWKHFPGQRSIVPTQQQRIIFVKRRVQKQKRRKDVTGKPKVEESVHLTRKGRKISSRTKLALLSETVSESSSESSSREASYGPPPIASFTTESTSVVIKNVTAGGNGKIGLRNYVLRHLLAKRKKKTGKRLGIPMLKSNDENIKVGFSREYFPQTSLSREAPLFEDEEFFTNLRSSNRRHETSTTENLLQLLRLIQQRRREVGRVTSNITQGSNDEDETEETDEKIPVYSSDDNENGGQGAEERPENVYRDDQ